MKTKGAAIWCSAVARMLDKDANIPVPAAEGGSIVEVTFTDLSDRNGVLSSVCPAGWYAYKMQGFGAVKFSTAPDVLEDANPTIRLLACAKLIDTCSFQCEGEPVSFTIDGVIWEGVYSREEEAIEVYTGKDGIRIALTSLGVDRDSDVLRQVMARVRYGWQ